MRTITAEAVKPLLTGPDEIAFLDVRERGQFGVGHPFFAVNLPYSRLESIGPKLVPRRSAPCVLMDDGDGVAEMAARRMIALGYTDVREMEGGARAWAAAGFTLYQGVNLPSKTFGELVEHAMHTPSISAEELKAAQEAGEDLVILDGRTPQEHQRMTIPGARFCPNAELGYRLPALNLRPETRIVVHCAGRTRSIIGAQTLRSLGVPQQVVALENGTQGWELAGFELTRGQVAETLPELSAPDREITRNAAQRLMIGAGIEQIGVDALVAERRDRSRTHYLLDVRTAREYQAGHIEGAQHVAGGQLVQATDIWIGVRNARLVLCDDIGLRAATTALWLRGMGHDVAVLDADSATARPELSVEPAHAPPALPAIGVANVRSRLTKGAVLIDLVPSMTYRGGHVEGARWAIRPRIRAMDLSGASEALLIALSPTHAEAAALDIAEHHGLASTYVAGTAAEWQAAGFRMVESPDAPSDADAIDYLFFTHDRHSGNLDAARDYLAWETGLISQLDEQERGALKPELSLPG